jgi:hypothetical protein
MGQPETCVGALCAELGITRQTLYRHVDPKGVLRPDGKKLLGTRTPAEPVLAYISRSHRRVVGQDGIAPSSNGVSDRCSNC